MTTQQVAEEIILYCEQMNDYQTRLVYVTNKINEIIQERTRNTESSPTDRSNDMRVIERDSQEIINRALPPFNPRFSEAD